MDDVIIASAKYLIYVMVLGFAAVWLFAENRRGKVDLAIAAVVGLIVVLILIAIAGSLHTDPRPFVVDPSLKPLIPHAPDNGFPSDHASAAGLMALLILLRHRIIGIVFAVAAVVVAWGRVAAHLHHVLDVSVGLGLGVIAALAGIAVATAVLRHTPLLRLRPVAWFVGDGSGGSPSTRDSLDREPGRSRGRHASE